MSKDYYVILGVKREATVDEIGESYRKLAMQYHPDRNPGDKEAEQKFKDAASAFEVLSDDVKRQEYDQFGSVGRMGSQTIHINPFDIFENIFGSPFRRSNKGSSRGDDVHKEVHITLEEAYLGCDKTIACDTHVFCENCNGSGVLEWDKCKMCAGQGQTVHKQGPMTIQMTCTRCAGRGGTPAIMCDKCNGEGRIVCETVENNINVPPGADQGMYLRVPGRGQIAEGGVAGDLICTLLIDTHAFYERDGQDLFCVVPITFAQAIMGYSTSLPVMSGKECEVKIPAGIESGKIIRVVGMGMPVAVDRMRKKMPYGDLLVRVDVQQPDKPSKKYRDLVKKLAEQDDEEIYGRIQQFESCIEKMRE